jgi:hypothetical protein
MAFNGSGTHVRVHDWTTDLAGAVPVTASRMDAEHDDISTALSTAICRDGQSTTTARIPFAAGTSAAAGTTASVAYSQTNDNNTGLYFPATDQWGLVAGGVATITSTATKVTLPVAVDFTGAAAPTSDDGAALGATGQKWSDLWLASGAVINFNSGDVTVTHSANSLAFAGGTSYTFDAAPLPASSDGAALGSGTVMWSDLFLASGAVINFNNGDVTVTHSANQIAVAGGTLACEALSPSGDVAVATNKFTVAAASGNTLVAGTLAVTGAQTNTGALVANNAAGITGRNTAKAFVTFTTDGSSVATVVGTAFNVTSVASATVDGLSGFRITFTNALPTSTYTVMGKAGPATGHSSRTVSHNTSNMATTTLDIVVVDGGGSVDSTSIIATVVVFDNA